MADYRTPPLRKIIGTYYDPGHDIKWDKLECGHTELRDDFSGHKRRRCHTCRQHRLRTGKPFEVG